MCPANMIRGESAEPCFLAIRLPSRSPESSHKPWRRLSIILRTGSSNPGTPGASVSSFSSSLIDSDILFPLSTSSHLNRLGRLNTASTRRHLPRRLEHHQGSEADGRTHLHDQARPPSLSPSCHRLRGRGAASPQRATRALERRGTYRALVRRRLARFFPALTGLWQTPAPLAFQRQVPRGTPSYADRTTHAASWSLSHTQTYTKLPSQKPTGAGKISR